MGLIPNEIKSVERPKNTDVRLLNNNYYVYPYERYWNKTTKKGAKKTLPYVGKIVLNESTHTWEFVPRQTEITSDVSGVKTWGDFYFVDHLSQSLKDELVSYYGDKIGIKIYVYALLRLLYGDKNSYLSDGYHHSFISEVYPNVAVSENSVLDFIKTLGLNDDKNKAFLTSRLNDDYRVLIFDGTQITNESNNAFSAFGRSAKKTNKPQMIEVKVFDTQRKEPVYYEVVPGNVVDKTSFIQILDRFDVSKAIIIVDKGFNSKENIDYLKEHNINFIIPFNDNAKIINQILDHNHYTHSFIFNGKTVKGMKVHQNEQTYYLFQDPYIAAKQESFYIKKLESGKKGYTMEALNQKQSKFGVICFISNQDLEDIKQIYIDYAERWEIETSVKLEKTSLENEVIRVHSTPGALGVRFLIQTEMIMISRVYQKLKTLGLLDKISIRETLKELNKTYKVRQSNKWKLSVMTKKKMKFLNNLGLPIS